MILPSPMPIPRPLAALLVLALALAAAPAGARPADAAPRIIALALPEGVDAAPGAVARAAALADAQIDASLPVRVLDDGSRYEPLPGFGEGSRPEASIVLLREARMRGQRVAVYAVGPGALAGAATASELAQVIAPAARPLDARATLAALDTAPFATGAPAPDPVAAGQAWKITVAAAGVQFLSAEALGAAGLSLGQVNVAQLQLRHRGREVALEEVRVGGALTGLRFYAEPGDRWNAASVYWLALGSGSGLRMATSDGTPAGATVVTAAIEHGAWRANSLYESRQPGPDGDHFFSADLRTGPSADGAQPATVSVTITTELPPAPGLGTLIIGGASVTNGAHSLQASTSGAAQQYDWTGAGAWSTRLTMERGTVASVALLPRANADSALVDSIGWELPVTLRLNGRGASFTGYGGSFTYVMEELPGGASLYDVTDPALPERISLANGRFQDSAATPRQYVVTGPGTLHAPPVVAHTPVDMGRPINVEALYIAPAALIPALAPLVEHRRAQGLQTAAIATEAIYDAWGGGQIDPEAIRSFLRYAAESWSVAPTSVTLVGDGSSDPRDYLGRANPTLVPPYLAPADPWLGETACEACYARLDGEDPLDDGLPDLIFGRLPAKSAAELEALVAKQLAYERSQAPGLWRATVAFVSDNPDLGGNFITAAEESIELQPEGARIARAYFDPTAAADDPFREADPLDALGRSMGALNGGAAVLHYTGHGQQFQWAYTGPPLRQGEPTDKQFLLGLYSVDELRNGPWQPVVLSMTCLTGSFHFPALSGTVIDERLVARPDGGAIAAWSSTGLGVLYGHDALQRGFYRALWAAPGQARLGALTMAGYLELYTTESCCQESIGTFALLGDPLTIPRVHLDVHALWAPLVRK
jgi:hypothetical protein